MKKEKTIGILLILGAIGVFIPYTILTIIFEYPQILRQEPAIILAKFHAGGPSLILTWWAFAILSLPLLIAYILIGQVLETKTGYIKWVTTMGVISGIVQIIGLLRWVFVVPVIANSYLNSVEPSSQAAAIMAFKTVHQFGGVLLGEHLGQLFTIVWTLMISFTIIKLRLFSSLIGWLGILSSLIYFFAQAELFATVIPGFPVWQIAGFLGSTLWLIWLLILGIGFLTKKSSLV